MLQEPCPSSRLKPRSEGRALPESSRLLLACLLLLVRSRGPAAHADARHPSEYEVKAAFLYHFAQLVTWPQEPRDEPVVIAVAGRDPFGRLLEKTIADETVRGRPIRIVRARTVAELKQLPEVLFLGASDLPQAHQMLAALGDAEVLTVGELPGFAQRGGMIEFRVTPERRVAFDINLHEAERAGLKISSQLLRIARIVESRP